MKGVFIHIPKNAGTSIKSILPNDCVSFKHHPAKNVKNLIEDYQDRFSFAFVRNPWDRLVSLYEFSRKRALNKKRTNLDWAKSIFNDSNKYYIALFNGDFNQFVQKLLQYKFICNYKKSPFHGHIQGWQQKEWVSENGKIIVDFIGRFENIKEDMSQLKTNQITKNILIIMILKQKD